MTNTSSKLLINLRAFIRDNTAHALVATAIVVCAIAFTRPVSHGINEETFWAMKRTASPADVVLAGDSRVYRGLSPGAMESQLPGRSVVNFAFSSNGYSAAYLREVENRLATKGPGGVVVLGISPFTLTPRSATETNFIELMRKPEREVRLSLMLRTLTMRFESVTTVKPTLEHAAYRQVFHEDGWAESRLTPPTPEYALTSYRTLFDGNRVDEGMLKNLLAQVEAWRRQGIRVYAFRPPTTAAMSDLENRLSGYPEAHVSERFEAAGGKWIDIPQTDVYECYDGSHIADTSAVQLSEAIAKVIRKDAQRQ